MARSSLLWLGSISVAMATLACSGGTNFVSQPTNDGGAGAAGSGGAAAGSGGVAGSAGTAATGGGGGVAATGGSGGVAAAGGAGGAPATDGGTACSDDATCGAGHYCGDDSVCHDCADTASFHFGKPEPLDHINAAHPGDYLRYPRATGDKGLVYTVEGPYGWTRAIWVTPDVAASAGVEATSSSDGSGGPLMTPPPGSGPLASYNFYFDTAVPNTLNRQIVGATIDGSGATTAAGVLPAPINDGNSNFSLALAVGSGRVWWSSDRVTGIFQYQLFTASVLGAGSATATQVSLTTAPANCPLDVTDPSPWATPDGKLLLFDSSEHYTDCNNKNAPLDMFVARPDASGKVSQQAGQIDVDLQSVNDSQPSLSPDMCWLYFASDRDGAKTTRLYRAHRR